MKWEVIAISIHVSPSCTPFRLFVFGSVQFSSVLFCSVLFIFNVATAIMNALYNFSVERVCVCVYVCCWYSYSVLRMHASKAHVIVQKTCSLLSVNAGFFSFE